MTITILGFIHMVKFSCVLKSSWSADFKTHQILTIWMKPKIVMVSLKLVIFLFWKWGNFWQAYIQLESSHLLSSWMICVTKLKFSTGFQRKILQRITWSIYWNDFTNSSKVSTNLNNKWQITLVLFDHYSSLAGLFCWNDKKYSDCL